MTSLRHPASLIVLVSMLSGLMPMGARAHEHSRQMVWTKVGAEYQALFARVAAAGGPLATRGRSLSVAHR